MKLIEITLCTGWVSYSLSALVSALGENSLMPNHADCRCKVINGTTGHTIDNSSWIISRIVRDFHNWNDPETVKKTAEVLDARWKELQVKNPNVNRPQRAGLVVTVYEPSMEHSAGVPRRDFMYWSGILTVFLQFGIATIPCGLFGDWSILMITACGTCISFATGFLPQWKMEKWACRTQSNDTYVLTKGNGAQHAIVILGNGYGLNLEDLAAGQTNINLSANRLTQIAIFGLCFLWLLLLIAASGLTTNTWFLLAVGGLGILQNIFVVGGVRQPESFGIHLSYITVFGRTKVMKTLLDVEMEYPRLGRSMRNEYFPGGLYEDEMKVWNQLGVGAKMDSNDKKSMFRLSGSSTWPLKRDRRIG